MKKYKGFIAGIVVGFMLASIPIFADSYTRAIEAVVNFTNIQVNGENVTSDNMLIDDRTYVWIRDVAEMLDKDIIWDEATNTANIVDKGSIPQTAITVNGQEITDRKIKAYVAANPGYSKEILIEDIIYLYVVGEKAESFGLKNKQAYIDEAMVTVEKYLAENGASFNEYLKQLGITKLEYAELMAESALYNDIIETAYTNLQADVALDDSILREKYNSNPSAYEKVTTKHILVNTEDEAKKICQELKNGADFDKLMSENSLDTASKDMPEGFTFGKGEMVPEFETASFALEVGKVSEPVKTAYGYHIIMVLDKSGTFEDAFDTLIEEVFMTYFDEMVESWRNEAEIIRNDDIINSIN